MRAYTIARGRRFVVIGAARTTAKNNNRFIIINAAAARDPSSSFAISVIYIYILLCVSVMGNSVHIVEPDRCVSVGCVQVSIYIIHNMQFNTNIATNISRDDKTLGYTDIIRITITEKYD